MDVGHFLGIVAYLLPVSVYWKTMGWRERGEIVLYADGDTHINTQSHTHIFI